MQIKIVSPNQPFEDTQVGFVQLRTARGYMGLGDGHAPALFKLAPGVLTTYSDREGKTPVGSYFIARGVCHIYDNLLTVLAETVEPQSKVDKDRAEKSYDRAQKRLEEKVGVDVDRALASLERAEVRKTL